MKYDDYTDIPPSDFEMRRLFEGGDELGVVLKGHLYVEHYLGLLLLKVTAADVDQVFGRVSFAEKIQKARQAGIVPADEEALYRTINKIRNRFAHQPRSYFSEGDAESIWNTLSARVKHRFANIERFGPDDFDLPLDLFKCCIAALCAILDSELRPDANAASTPTV